MKKFLIFCILFLFVNTAYAQAPILTGHTFNIPAIGPNGPNGLCCYVVFLNTQNPPIPQPGVWNQVDVTTWGLPANTLAVNAGGFLIITNEGEQGTANLTIAVREPGSNVSCGNYVAQTILVNPPANNGVRQLANFWIPINNSKFEFCWQRGIMGSEFPSSPLGPNSPPYAINLLIEAWITP